MKTFGGWHFPDGELHLIDLMRRHDRRVSGRLSYQYEKLEAALGFTLRRRTAVDVGAHIGLWSYHLCNCFYAVHAFEPIPAHLECFRMNVARTNVVLHPVALGAMAGELRLATDPASSGDTRADPTGDIVVAMERLDDAGLKDVDFVKIDCEGYELDVLKGGEETIRRDRPTIIVEQKPNKGSRYFGDDRAALAYLERLGYVRRWEHAGDFVLTRA